MNVALHTDCMKSGIKAEESADWLLPFIGDKKHYLADYCQLLGRRNVLLSIVTSSNTASVTVSHH